MGDPELFITSNISLDNVWICTTHPDNEPLTVTQDLGTGGCLGSDMDTGFPKHIVQSRVPDSSVVKGDVTLYRPFVNKTIRFSFPIECTVERTHLYVHVQSTIDIVSGTSRRRRLLADDSGSKNTHFAGSVGVTVSSSEEGPDADQNDGTQQPQLDEELFIVKRPITSMIIAGCLICACIFAIIVHWHRKKRNSIRTVPYL